jgi:hypothetical protein
MTLGGEAALACDFERSEKSFASRLCYRANAFKRRRFSSSLSVMRRPIVAGGEEFLKRISPFGRNDRGLLSAAFNAPAPTTSAVFLTPTS